MAYGPCRRHKIGNTGRQKLVCGKLFYSNMYKTISREFVSYKCPVKIGRFSTINNICNNGMYTNINTYHTSFLSLFFWGGGELHRIEFSKISPFRVFNPIVILQTKNASVWKITCISILILSNNNNN